MKLLRKVTAFVILAAILIFSLAPILRVEAITSLHPFMGAGQSDGATPYGSLLESKDVLYGTTKDGGANDLGTLFSYNPDTTDYHLLYSFDGTTGSHPTGSIIFNEGVFYGMTTMGGTNDKGVLFSYDELGNYTVLLEFGITDGAHPHGTPFFLDNTLYGLTREGGTNDLGSIFSYNLNTSVYTKIFSFGDVGSGVYPEGDLLFDHTGHLYGMTSAGGTNGKGTLFSLELLEGAVTKLIDFGGGSATGEYPYGSLIINENGRLLYGMTSAGGTSNYGTIFSVDPDHINTLQTLHSFDGEHGKYPYGSLFVADDGKYYGTTMAGGTNDHGTLFSYDINDPFQIPFEFIQSFDRVSHGAAPRGSLIQKGKNGSKIFYGLASDGGSPPEQENASFGTIFSFPVPDKAPEPFSFPQVTGAQQNTEITSEQITITGINTPSAIAIDGCNTVCRYSGGTDGYANEGDTLTITIVSGNGCETTKGANLVVGSVSAQFLVTTASCSSGGGQDVTRPQVSFSLPNTGSSLTVSLTFSATDNVGVTGYKLTETNTAPSAGDSGWSASAPTEYTFSSYGSHTLYAWAKDAAGNVSAQNSQSITLTEPAPADPAPQDPPAQNPPRSHSSNSAVAGIGALLTQPMAEPRPEPEPVPAPEPAPEPKPVERPKVTTPAVSIVVLDSPVKQLIREEFTPHQVEVIEVSIKAIIATVTTVGAILVLLSVLFLNPLARPEFILIPIRLWTLLLTALGLRKKSTPWGVVYDSVTKQPIDPVRVSLVDMQGAVVESSITDASGRYGFAAPAGIYKVVLSKTNYLFPSHVIAQNDMRDEFYDKPYFGDYLPYDPAAPIMKNIPIDPLDFDTAAFEQKNGDLSLHYSKRELVADRIFNTLFLTTFLIVAVSLIIYPEMYNAIIFVLYIAAFIIRRHTKRLKHMGRIYDLYGKPLANVVMKVYSAVDNTLVKTTKTTRAGRYYLHVPKGLYHIRVERQTTDGMYVPIYDSPELLVQHGTVNKVFNIAYS